jgi:hypothetical protein
MNDLDIAIERLHNRKLALVFVKNSLSIYETKTGGLGGFLTAINNLGSHMSCSSVADRVIGKAAALLCSHSQVKSAYAVTMSKNGLDVLKKQSIPFKYGNLTPMILNVKKTEQCPFEKLVEGISDPKIAYSKIRELHNSLINQSLKLDT